MVFLNNDPIDIASDNSLQDLMGQTGFSDKVGIAVAINNKVVPKTKWNETILQDNDKVIVISATKGG